MSVYTDFKKFVTDVEASTTYTNWCGSNPADCSAWQDYRASLLAFLQPLSAPTMGTSLGRALVDVGIMAVDDGLGEPVTTQPQADFSYAIV